MRRPFGVVSVNTLHNQVPPPVRSSAAPAPTVVKPPPPAPPPQLSWALLRQLVISLPEEAAARLRGYPAEKLEYYRFPFPELPADARGRLSKLLAQRTEGAELGRSCFQKIIESWRRALLSLYQTLRSGRIEYFYHLQSDLVVLFRRDDAEGGELLAHVTKASKALIKLLKEEGVPLAVQTASGGPDDDGEHEGASKEAPSAGSASTTPAPPSSAHHPSSSLPDDFEGDRENERPMDAKTVKSLVHDRLSRARKTQSRRRSAAAVTLTVRGEMGVHTLVDFILNQKDGRSFVILPELVAPGPFLYGTLCRSELSVVGPIVGGDHQARLGGGILLPTLCKSILEQALVPPTGGGPLSLKPTIDDRTDAFLSFICR